MKKTRIIAVRGGEKGFGIERLAMFMIQHADDVSPLPALERCFTDWLRLPENESIRAYTAGDFNFGDILCMGKPDDEFSERYGIRIENEEPDVEELIVDYDHVLDLGDPLE